MPVRMMHGRGGPFLTEEEKASRPKVTKELLIRIAGHLGPYWKQLILALLCVTASSILNLYPAILTGHIVEEGTHTGLLQTGGVYSELYRTQYGKELAA